MHLNSQTFHYASIGSFRYRLIRYMLWSGWTYTNTLQYKGMDQSGLDNTLH